jgi:hypothetical protein
VDGLCIEHWEWAKTVVSANLEGPGALTVNGELERQPWYAAVYRWAVWKLARGEDTTDV